MDTTPTGRPSRAKPRGAYKMPVDKKTGHKVLPSMVARPPGLKVKKVKARKRPVGGIVKGTSGSTKIKPAIPGYTRERADEVLRLIGEGMSLKQLCRDPNMPNRCTVQKWVRDDIEGFQERYHEAKQLRHDHWADEIIEISDDGSNDYMDKEMKDGRIVRVLDPENVNRSRLRVDTRKFLLSKLDARFADRTDISLGGRNGSAAVPILAVTATAEEASRAYMELINGDTKK